MLCVSQPQPQRRVLLQSAVQPAACPDDTWDTRMCLETSCDLQTAAGGHDVVVVVPELALGEESVVVDVCAFEQHARVRQLHHVEDFFGRDADALLGVLVRVVDESALNLRLLGVHLRFGNTSIGRKLSKFTIICLILCDFVDLGDFGRIVSRLAVTPSRELETCAGALILCGARWGGTAVAVETHAEEF